MGVGACAMQYSVVLCDELRPYEDSDRAGRSATPSPRTACGIGVRTIRSCGSWAGTPRGTSLWRMAWFAALVLLAAATACGGSWQGSIGAVLGKDNQDGRVYVRELPSDMAAARAGLAVGDEIVAIDGTSVREMNASDIHKALQGDVGTKVRLTVT